MKAYLAIIFIILDQDFNTSSSLKDVGQYTDLTLNITDLTRDHSLSLLFQSLRLCEGESLDFVCVI